MTKHKMHSGNSSTAAPIATNSSVAKSNGIVFAVSASNVVLMASVGMSVGDNVESTFVGASDGLLVGSLDGYSVGTSDGDNEGDTVGSAVGDTVITTLDAYSSVKLESATSNVAPLDTV